MNQNCSLKYFTEDKWWCRIFTWFFTSKFCKLQLKILLGNHGSAEPPLLLARPCVPPAGSAPPANQDQRRWMRQRESGEACHWLTQTSSHSLELQVLNLLKKGYWRFWTRACGGGVRKFRGRIFIFLSFIVAHKSDEWQAAAGKSSSFSNLLTFSLSLLHPGQSLGELPVQRKHRRGGTRRKKKCVWR